MKNRKRLFFENLNKKGDLKMLFEQRDFTENLPHIKLIQVRW